MTSSYSTSLYNGCLNDGSCSKFSEATLRNKRITFTTDMETLILSEKPSQAMDIARVIGVKSRQDGYLELVDGSKITWAVGHLLELCSPPHYNEEWGKRWSWNQLPMLVDSWEYEVKDRTKKQFNVIKRLLKTTKRVIIATDAGREGELIAREILDHLKYKGAIERFWTSLLTPNAIKDALRNLKPGAETYNLYESAKTRSHADWLLGYTGSRAATLACDVPRTTFPLGRVQTPTLGMVVKRCEDVRNFVPQVYFEIEATVQTKKGELFTMTHSPKDAERILTREEAERRIQQAMNYVGPLKVEKTEEREAPPLPYSLTSLSKDADKALGLSAANTLKVAQKLYEAKHISYPRTGCEHLGQDQLELIPATLKAVASKFPSHVNALNREGIVTRPSTFDDSKLSDHHAIIPSELPPIELSEVEWGLYTLICMRFLQALAPDAIFAVTRVQLNANGVLFRTTGKTSLSAGWRSLKGEDLG